MEWLTGLSPEQIGGIIAAIVAALTGGSVSFTVWWRRRPFKVTWDQPANGGIVASNPYPETTIHTAPRPPSPSFEIEWADEEEEDGASEGHTPSGPSAAEIGNANRDSRPRQ